MWRQEENPCILQAVLSFPEDLNCFMVIVLVPFLKLLWFSPCIRFCVVHFVIFIRIITIFQLYFPT